MVEETRFDRKPLISQTVIVPPWLLNRYDKDNAVMSLPDTRRILSHAPVLSLR